MIPIKSQIEGSMAVLAAWNKADAFKRLIPQKVEGGVVYNAMGQVIGSAADCEDFEIVPFDTLNGLNRVTATTTRIIFGRVNEWIDKCFGTEEAPTEGEAPTEEAKEFNESLDAEHELNNLLRDGEFKKAKKYLKEVKGKLPKSVIKAVKKQIKEGLNG